MKSQWESNYYFWCKEVKKTGKILFAKSLKIGKDLNLWMDFEISFLLLLHNLNVPNIIRILHIYEEKKSNTFRSQLSVLFPLCGQFNPKIISTISLKQISTIILQVSNTIENLHKLGIFHGNIKTSSIVFTPNARKIETFIVNFDFAELMYPGITHRCTGTKGFIAKEVRLGAPIILQSDLYSLGVVLIHFLFPFLHPYWEWFNKSLEEELEGFKKSPKGYIGYLIEYLDKEFLVSPPSSPSPPSDELLQLCKIAVNLTQSDPLARQYLTPDMLPSFPDEDAEADEKDDENGDDDEKGDDEDEKMDVDNNEKEEEKGKEVDVEDGKEGKGGEDGNEKVQEKKSDDKGEDFSEETPSDK